MKFHLPAATALRWTSAVRSPAISRSPGENRLAEEPSLGGPEAEFLAGGRRMVNPAGAAGEKYIYIYI